MPITALGVTPLPPDDRFLEGSTVHDAYESVLRFRNRMVATDQTLWPLFLGHLLREVPVKENLAREILACHDNDKNLTELAAPYINVLVGTFKRREGRTPAPSEHPSRPSFDADVEIIAYAQHHVVRDGGHGKALALVRDSYRGIAGGLDRSQRESNPGIKTIRTEAAHIIPFNVGSTPTLSQQNDPWAGGLGVLSVLQRIGGIPPTDLDGSTSGSSIGRLSNLITMGLDEHANFDDLEWWMEPVSDGTPHRYSIHRMYNMRLPEEVTFTTPNLNLERPDPRFIAMHAACCRVAHLSGAADYIERIHREMDSTLVLAPDGGSARILDFALSRLALVDRVD